MENVVETGLRFKPRKYQQALVNYILGGGKRAVVVWHRRAGKDLTLLNVTLLMAWFHRVGTYYVFYPTYSQGKKILWDGMDNEGVPYLNYIPDEMIARDSFTKKKKIDETDMQVTLANGSIIQVIGTDRFDRVRGTNPVGCVFSEYQAQNPKAYDTVDPILAANGGWAAFAYTPEGQNHGYDLYQFANREAGWFSEILTINDTRTADGLPVVTEEYVEGKRREGKDEDFLQQEYYCSFRGITQGSYYGKQIQEVEASGRVTSLPISPDVPVNTYWDLGYNDTNAVWYVQKVGPWYHVIDYHEGRQLSLVEHVKIIKDKGYLYGEHWFPHDVNVHELTTGKTRKETVEALLGVRSVQVTPKLSREEGIDMARRIFAKAKFDGERCKEGLRALRQYHKAFDEVKNVFTNTPVHDWASNGADAFRYFAVADVYEAPVNLQQRADSTFKAFIGRAQREADNRFDVW